MTHQPSSAETFDMNTSNRTSATKPHPQCYPSSPARLRQAPPSNIPSQVSASTSQNMHQNQSYNSTIGNNSSSDNVNSNYHSHNTRFQAPHGKSYPNQYPAPPPAPSNAPAPPPAPPHSSYSSSPFEGENRINSSSIMDSNPHDNQGTTQKQKYRPPHIRMQEAAASSQQSYPSGGFNNNNSGNPSYPSSNSGGGYYNNKSGGRFGNMSQGNNNNSYSHFGNSPNKPFQRGGSSYGGESGMRGGYNNSYNNYNNSNNHYQHHQPNHSTDPPPPSNFYDRVRQNNGGNDSMFSSGGVNQNNNQNPPPPSGYNAGINNPRSVTKTGWDVRNGRRYYPENEHEIFDSTPKVHTGINFDSYDDIPVEITGSGVDQLPPIENFQATTDVHPLLMKNVNRVNYSRPTPVQKHAIPVVITGRDLMACAQTGSGKTAAFLFPVISTLLNNGPPAPHQPSRVYLARRDPAVPVCLVLSPTRELTLQIYHEARKFAYGTGIRTCVVYGGNDVRAQIYDLDKGCDICVATPGRLKDLMDRNKVNLECVRHLVLDEADRMLDMGFYPQMKEIVLMSKMPTSRQGRQTVMFSATFPREVQQLARDFLLNYIFLSVGRVGSTNTFILQKLQYVQEDQKLVFLMKLLRETHQGLILIFVETKRKADQIEGSLIDENFKAVSIHGDKSQNEREEALRYFKDGRCRIMVATDVAARGLDIPNITHVINFDLPNNVDDYVHRIGRTGRAGNKGLATSFVNESNWPVFKDLINILNESQQEIPNWFQSIVAEHSQGKGGRGGGRYGSNNNRMGNRGGGNMGSRDIRGNNDHAHYTHGKNSHQGGRVGGGGDNYNKHPNQHHMSNGYNNHYGGQEHKNQHNNNNNSWKQNNNSNNNNHRPRAYDHDLNSLRDDVW